MSSIYRIEENMEQFTVVEKKIGKYILKNIDTVISSSTKTIAKEINTSTASIVRFAQRIGYAGFAELKIELAQHKFDDDEKQIDTIIQDDDSLDLIVEKSKKANELTFKHTYELLSLIDLENAIKKVKNAKRIYLFGVGGSGLVCKDLYQKLLRVNLDVVYNEDYHMQMLALSHASEDDLAIAISYSGETREVIVPQEVSKKKGLATIGITQVGNSPLTKHSEFIFQIPKEETELRLGSISSRFSMLAITDLIYLGLVQSNSEQARKEIVKTRKFIQEYR